MTEIPRAEHGYFLLSLEEPDVNELRVALVEVERGEQVPTPVGYAHELVTTERSAHYEIFWSDYIAYAVRNESYSRFEEGVAPEAPQLRKRDRSAFLDYVSAATIASEAHPGPFTHWELVCLDHVIDVASARPPMVSRMP